MSRDGLFLRVCIADAAPDVQMAQRISVKLRITVVAVGLSDTNVSRETVKKLGIISQLTPIGVCAIF